MAKKKSMSGKKLLLTFVELVLAVVAFFMIFAPSIVIDNNDVVEVFKGLDLPTQFTGADVAFGYAYSKTIIITTTLNVFGSSFMAMLPYILLVVAAALALIKLIVRPLNNTIVKLIMFVCFLAAGVLFIVGNNFIVVHDDLKKAVELLGINVAESFKITTGYIVAAVLSFLGVVGVSADIIIKK